MHTWQAADLRHSVQNKAAHHSEILADTFFVSKGLGTSGLAALNIAIPVYNFIHGHTWQAADLRHSVQNKAAHHSE